MTKAEYKEVITPEIVRRIFEGCTVESNNSKYAITVGGKIISVGGKIFYDSHEQAIKGFYNSFSWRARRIVWESLHPNENPWGWWRNEDRSVVWSAFKEVLKEKYGFDIIQL